MKIQSQALSQSYAEQQQMSSQNDNGIATFQASPSFISAYTVVDVNADGTITNVVAGSQGIGVAQEDIPVNSTANLAAAYYGKIKLWTAPGTFMVMTNGGAITPGNQYQLISGGTVGASAGGVTAVKALQAGAAAAGVIVEFAGLL